MSGAKVHRFGFRLSWDWLQHGWGRCEKPFLHRLPGVRRGVRHLRLAGSGVHLAGKCCADAARVASTGARPSRSSRAAHPPSMVSVRSCAPRGAIMGNKPPGSSAARVQFEIQREHCSH